MIKDAVKCWYDIFSFFLGYEGGASLGNDEANQTVVSRALYFKAAVFFVVITSGEFLN